MSGDEKEVEGSSSRGTDWEVVSLTASTYAAAPGPKDLDTVDERKEKDVSKSERGSSSDLFMSEHFVFPPSEHENLPIVPDYSEIHSESEGRQVAGDVATVHETEFFDEGKGLPEGEELNLVGEEEFTLANDDSDESDEPSQQGESPTKHAKKDEDDKYCGSGLPCESWLQRHATCLYRHAKETTTLWSVVVAAALVGLVILGQKWHHEKLQLHQLKWRFNVKK
uniref:ATG8-interacting protein 1 n=1 Tax=Ananas comosus var. bracteatus TaxID=296719 RepID=A0A6V7PY62_ANACO|nr:unnamed protein product [Ananas comosus var. bracteatus]